MTDADNPLLWPRVEIPEHLWEEGGDDGADGGSTSDRLQCAVYLNGVPLHLDARAAVVGADGIQAFAPGAYPADQDPLWEALGGDREYFTLEIRGRDYVVFASPFST